MKRNLADILLFGCTMISGFYAGTGFFVAMGGNPAIRLMSEATFAEYWQHTDHYMAARMKIFGPLLLLTVLVSTIVLFRKQRTAFYCMLVAFLILLADIAFVLSTNHPLNQYIQSWDLSNLPPDVGHVKNKLVAAFETRLLFMISCFVMVLFAVWTRNRNNNFQYKN